MFYMRLVKEKVRLGVAERPKDWFEWPPFHLSLRHLNHSVLTSKLHLLWTPLRYLGHYVVGMAWIGFRKSIMKDPELRALPEARGHHVQGTPLGPRAFLLRQLTLGRGGMHRCEAYQQTKGVAAM